MPLYEYRCGSCAQTFEQFTPMAEYLDPKVCGCGGEGVRLLSRFSPVGTTRADSLNDLRTPLGRSFTNTREVDKFLKEKGIARVDDVRPRKKNHRAEEAFKQDVAERLTQYGV